MKSQIVEELVNELCRLPGIGTRSATRIAYHLLNRPREDVAALIDTLRRFMENVRVCSVCFNVSETDPCPICADENRDHSTICVVEEPQDLAAIENTEAYNGVYHILGGVLNPLDGITPEKLHISELLNRIDSGNVKELIIALNPTPEGETTTLYLMKELSGKSVKITTLAQGISAGSDLEFADKRTIRQAIENRREVSSD